MKNVYLTIHIDSKEECFDKINAISRLNIEDAFKLREIQLKEVGEYEIFRTKLVLEIIEENKVDLLIGNAIREKGQLTKIVESMNSDKSIIRKLFYDDGKRKKADLEKYKKDYALHSNWMDYSPEHVEHFYEQLETKLKLIFIEAKEHAIEVVAI